MNQDIWELSLNEQRKDKSLTYDLFGGTSTQAAHNKQQGIEFFLYTYLAPKYMTIDS